MSLFRHIVGIAAELFLQADPYDRYSPPRATGSHKDECGRDVLEVNAQSYKDVDRVADYNLPGMTVHTKVGRGKWEVRQEDIGEMADRMIEQERQKLSKNRR